MSNNIVIDLLIQYFTEEKATAIILVILSLIVNGIQAQGISCINAEFIQSAEMLNRGRTIRVFLYLCIAFLAFLVLNSIYTNLQNHLLTKMRQWIRFNMLNSLLESNKENMDEINYPNMSSPINRTAAVCFMLFSSIFNTILPDMSFIVVISCFLLFTQPSLGMLFIFGNAIIGLLIWLNWNDMFEKNKTAVETEYDNEASLLEILHNFDKIIYRGQTNHESNIFKEKSRDAFEKSFEFQKTLERYGLYINSIVAVIVAIILWLLIGKLYSKDVSITYFITVLTMVLLYREKMTWVVNIIPDCVEFVGRSNTVITHFKDVPLNKITKPYENTELPFHKIEFNDVSFKYKSSLTNAVSDETLTIETSKHDIIGLTGDSGKGKSTVMKILLKMSVPNEGSVLIDGVDIKDISPDYIRKNITYVSQNGKLFDRAILENIMYGCSYPDSCSEELKQVLKYPKIRKLFRNIDIKKERAGNLGEHLSGGQRQVVNIVGGLINPCKILILDEPTNALDRALKMEIMQLIEDYSKDKNAILIITHDKDMDQIFTEKIEM